MGSLRTKTIYLGLSLLLLAVSPTALGYTSEPIHQVWMYDYDYGQLIPLMGEAEGEMNDGDASFEAGKTTIGEIAALTTSNPDPALQITNASKEKELATKATGELNSAIESYNAVIATSEKGIKTADEGRAATDAKDTETKNSQCAPLKDPGPCNSHMDEERDTGFRADGGFLRFDIRTAWFNEEIGKARENISAVEAALAGLATVHAQVDTVIPPPAPGLGDPLTINPVVGSTGSTTTNGGKLLSDSGNTSNSGRGIASTGGPSPGGVGGLAGSSAIKNTGAALGSGEEGGDKCANGACASGKSGGSGDFGATGGSSAKGGAAVNPADVKVNNSNLLAKTDQSGRLLTIWELATIRYFPHVQTLARIEKARKNIVNKNATPKLADSKKAATQNPLIAPLKH